MCVCVQVCMRAIIRRTKAEGKIQSLIRYLLHVLNIWRTFLLCTANAEYTLLYSRVSGERNEKENHRKNFREVDATSGVDRYKRYNINLGCQKEKDKKKRGVHLHKKRNDVTLK